MVQTQYFENPYSLNSGSKHAKRLGKYNEINNKKTIKLNANFTVFILIILIV